MAASTASFDGSNGALPSTPLTGGFTGMAWDSAPNDSTSDAALTTSTKLVGTAALEVLPAATYALYRDTTTIVSTNYGSVFLYLTAAPSNGFVLMSVNGDAGGAYSSTSKVGITTDRRVFGIARAHTYNIGTDSATTNGTYNASGANAVPVGNWCRVEWTITQTSAQIAVYNLGGTLIDSAAASSTTIGTVQAADVGAWSANASTSRTFISSGQRLYLDNLMLDSASMPTQPAVSVPGTSYAGIVPI